MSLRAAFRTACVLVLATALGCGTEPERKPPPGPVALQPPNNTPQNAVLRLIAAYEQKKIAEYDGLFTGDFTFQFSPYADPELAQKYAMGWFVVDELLSARHMFQGFTDSTTGFHPAAKSIDLTFAQTAPGGNTEYSDTTKYKVLATRVDGLFVVPPGGGYTEDTRYVIDNNYHRFFLVRGDAAQELEPSQPADSTHWYVYRWIDETAISLAPSAEVRATRSTTWAQVKDLYR